MRRGVRRGPIRYPIGMAGRWTAWVAGALLLAALGLYLIWQEPRGDTAAPPGAGTAAETGSATEIEPVPSGPPADGVARDAAPPPPPLRASPERARDGAPEAGSGTSTAPSEAPIVDAAPVERAARAAPVPADTGPDGRAGAAGPTASATGEESESAAANDAPETPIPIEKLLSVDGIPAPPSGLERDRNPHLRELAPQADAGKDGAVDRLRIETGSELEGLAGATTVRRLDATVGVPVNESESLELRGGVGVERRIEERDTDTDPHPSVGFEYRF